MVITSINRYVFVRLLTIELVPLQKYWTTLR